MPFCPRCRSEYRPGFSRCADCDVALVEALPAPPAEEAPGDWVEVFRGNGTQADLLRAALEDAGIPTLSPDEQSSMLGWYAPGTFDIVRVLVKASDAARSKEILGQVPPPE